MQHASSANGGTRAGSNGPSGALVVRAVRSLAELRVSAIVLTRRGSPVATLLAERPPPHPLVVVHDEEELYEARREISVASLFGVGDQAPVDAPSEIEKTSQFWPGTRCVWFSQHTTPSFPSRQSRAWIELELRGPLRDPVKVVELLHERIRLGAAARQLDVAAGLAFARHHGLCEGAEVVCAAVACGIPSDRLAVLVDKTAPGAFATHCSRDIYKLVGVRTLADLVSRIMRFRLSSMAIQTPSEARSAARRSGT